VLGSVAALLSVETGFETAVAAALGAAADAVVVSDLGAAEAAIRLLKDDDAGRVGLLVDAGPADDADAARPAPAPAGARPALDVVSMPPPLRSAVTRLLAGVVVVDDLPAAQRVVEQQPSLVAVTREGDVLGRSQSGFRSSLQNLRVLRDEKTIVEAREAAIALLDDDPGLDQAPELRRRVTELQESRQSEFMEKS